MSMRGKLAILAATLLVFAAWLCLFDHDQGANVDLCALSVAIVTVALLTVCLIIVGRPDLGPSFGYLPLIADLPPPPPKA